MSQYVNTPTKGFKSSSGAIGANLLVKIVSGTTVAIAGLAEEPIGVTENAAFATNDPVSVRLLSAQGTIQCKASGTFSIGAVVYGRAAGVVDDISTSSAVRIGIALEAATGANDIIEVLPC